MRDELPGGIGDDGTAITYEVALEHRCRVGKPHAAGNAEGLRSLIERKKLVEDGFLISRERERGHVHRCRLVGRGHELTGELLATVLGKRFGHPERVAVLSCVDREVRIEISPRKALGILAHLAEQSFVHV